MNQSNPNPKRKRGDAANPNSKRKQGMTQALTVPTSELASSIKSDLLDALRSMIEQTRTATARAVNSAIVLLYWSVGQRIQTEILKEQRAEYGKQILATLSKELVKDFGSGFYFD